MTSRVLWGIFFTINESICLRKRHVFLQIGKKASYPLPSTSPVGTRTGTLETFSNARLSFLSPFPSSWDEANILLTSHLILRSFKADSKLWKEMSRTGWFSAVQQTSYPPPPLPLPQASRGQKTWSLRCSRTRFESQPLKGGASERAKAQESRGCLLSPPPFQRSAFLLQK